MHPPQLPLSQPDILAAVEVIESELACGVPWRTTEAFVTCYREGRAVLDVTQTAGDPTGRLFTHIFICCRYV